jgi:chaperone required for assembly of F1-ATPase
MTEWAAKRFWTKTHVTEADQGFTVTLDDRPLRTPGRALLVVPSRALALELAEEWQAQGSRVDPSTMPITRMANSAIDRVGPRRAEVVEYVAAYGGTDLLCYRAEGPHALVGRQSEAWDPMLDWAERTLGARLAVTAGIMPVPQPPEALSRLTDHVAAQTDFGLTALHDLVSLTGSLILGLAACGTEFDARELWQCSRVDEAWQIEQWGPDDDAEAVAQRRFDAFLDAHRFFHSAQKFS